MTEYKEYWRESGFEKQTETVMPDQFGLQKTMLLMISKMMLKRMLQMLGWMKAKVWIQMVVARVNQF